MAKSRLIMTIVLGIVLMNVLGMLVSWRAGLLTSSDRSPGEAVVKDSQADSEQFVSNLEPQMSRGELEGYPIQDPHHPCGPVCMSLVSRLLDRPASLEECVRALSPDAMGRTSMAELVDGLESKGFAAAGVKLEPGSCDKLSVPLIIHQQPSHFSVLMPSGSTHVVMLDPPFPPAILSGEQLEKLWNGNTIIVAKDHEQLSEQLKTIGISTLRK